MSASLLPCPFCGGEAHAGTVRYAKALECTTWDDGSEITEGFFVNCASCSVSNRGIEAGYRTVDEAIAAWNRRAPVSADADDETLQAQNRARVLAERAELSALKKSLRAANRAPSEKGNG